MYILVTLLYAITMGFIANSYLLIAQMTEILYILAPVFLFVNLFAGIGRIPTRHFAIKLCHHGTVMLECFCISALASILCQTVLAFVTLPQDYMTFLWNALFCIGINAVIFWNGILSVYLTSTQLGIKMRVIGILCGLIPVVNIIVLLIIMKLTTQECRFEAQKKQQNRQRAHLKVCATKYPILLVHGVFFRDFRFFNYWGRVPRELEDNGAKVFYGNHPSAASIADSAAFLKTRIAEILAETGAKKVNIIAHSKGGLDCRYAIAKLGIGDSVASLTTVNTPHRGCLFADYLLEKIPSDIQDQVASAYNSALRKFGEPDADFMAAVTDLTQSHCQPLDAEMPQPEGIYCQSIGSVMACSKGGRFPLNFSYHLVKHFSGENDGLVSEESFRWGENYTLLRPSGKRGISHGDIIDLTRANIEGFDVREFFVNLVIDLKSRGL